MKKLFLLLSLLLSLGISAIPIQAEEDRNIKTYQLKKERIDNIDSIIADLGYIDLAIEPSKDSHIYLSYELHCENTKNPLTYQAKNNVLKIKEKKWKSISWKKYYKTWNQEEYNKYNKNIVTLSIPTEKTLKNSTCTTNDGNMIIKNLNCNHINLEANYGDITIKNSVISGKAKINTKDGNVTVKNTSASENTAFIAKYGDISVSDFQSKKEIEIKTEDGNVTVKNTSTSENAVFMAKYGDISVSDFQSKKEMKIKTKNGNVTVKNASLLEPVILITKYGDIFGSNIITPKDIQIKTTDGNVKFQMNEKQLKQRKIIIDTTDGNISIPYRLSNSSKKEKSDGSWHYEKEKNSEKALLKITTSYGDVSLKK